MENINWEAILIGATSLITIASLVANLTPNQTDNKIIDVLKKIIDVFALNFKKK